jgi:hypothetical protein
MIKVDEKLSKWLKARYQKQSTEYAKAQKILAGQDVPRWRVDELEKEKAVAKAEMNLINAIDKFVQGGK